MFERGTSDHSGGVLSSILLFLGQLAFAPVGALVTALPGFAISALLDRPSDPVTHLVD